MSDDKISSFLKKCQSKKRLVFTFRSRVLILLALFRFSLLHPLHMPNGHSFCGCFTSWFRGQRLNKNIIVTPSGRIKSFLFLFGYRFQTNRPAAVRRSRHRKVVRCSKVRDFRPWDPTLFWLRQEVLNKVCSKATDPPPWGLCNQKWQSGRLIFPNFHLHIFQFEFSGNGVLCLVGSGRRPVDIVC